MKKYKLFLNFLFIAITIASCEKNRTDHKADFNKSYQEWLTYKRASANSYRYTVAGGSWTGIAWQTDISVSEGKVMQRHFKLSFPAGWTGNTPASDEMEWTENENEINSHTNTAAAEAVTLDEIYEKARTNWLKKRSNAKTYFEAKNNGLISLCGYSENGCQDDCFNGITIVSIE